MNKKEIAELDMIYTEAYKGVDTPNYAALHVPGLGIVELARGKPVLINGVPAGRDEWDKVRDYVSKMTTMKVDPATPGAS